MPGKKSLTTQLNSQFVYVYAWWYRSSNLKWFSITLLRSQIILLSQNCQFDICDLNCTINFPTIRTFMTLFEEQNCNAVFYFAYDFRNFYIILNKISRSSHVFTDVIFPFCRLCSPGPVSSWQFTVSDPVCIVEARGLRIRIQEVKNVIKFAWS